MSNVVAIFKRELRGYFVTPVAYVFLAIFLLLTAFFAFGFGSLYERGYADLMPFFFYHPFLYLFLVPALSMRLWSEERKTGTIELLMTLPISSVQAVLGKFLAAWAFTGIALASTFLTWLTVIYLGDPDNGAIVAGYLGSFLMAGGFLAIGSCVSALTKNQVIAFVLSVVLCLFLVLIGFSPVLEWYGSWMWEPLVEAIASFSFWTHFQSISKGVVDLRDLVFFGSLVGLFLFANTAVVELKKAD